jgi:hypothetical protein
LGALAYLCLQEEARLDIMVSNHREPQIDSLKLLEWAITALGFCAFAHSLYKATSGPLNTEWLLLSFVTVVLISRIDIGLPKSSSSITLSDTFIFTSVLLYGVPLSVLLAGIEGAINSLVHKEARRFTLFNFTALSLSIFVSGSALTLLPNDFRQSSTRLGYVLAAAALLAFFHFIINSGLVGFLVARRHYWNYFAVWKDSLLWASLSTFVGAAAACIIYQLISVVSFVAFIIIVPVLAIAYFSYKVYLEKVEASNRHAEEMAALHLRTIEALAIAIDAKDEVTHDHVRRVQL